MKPARRIQEAAASFITAAPESLQRTIHLAHGSGVSSWQICRPLKAQGSACNRFVWFCRSLLFEQNPSVNCLELSAKAYYSAPSPPPPPPPLSLPISLSISLSLSLSVSLCLSLSLSVSLSVSLCLSVCLSLCLSLSPPCLCNTVVSMSA